MDLINSVLSFNGYAVNKLYFEKNNSFDGDKNNVTLSPRLTRKIKAIGENQYIVGLEMSLLNETGKESLPFFIEVELAGKFEVQPNYADSEVLINQNAVAILFPYLRALVSNLTVNANISPLILPIVNISKIMNEENEAPLKTD